MPNDLRSQISAEIKRVQGEIDQQKQLIKHNIAKKLVVETAEQEMKALHYPPVGARSQSRQGNGQAFRHMRRF